MGIPSWQIFPLSTLKILFYCFLLFIYCRFWSRLLVKLIILYMWSFSFCFLLRFSLFGVLKFHSDLSNYAFIFSFSHVMSYFQSEDMFFFSILENSHSSFIWILRLLTFCFLLSFSTYLSRHILDHLFLLSIMPSYPFKCSVALHLHFAFWENPSDSSSKF